MRTLDFLFYPIAISSCNTSAVENYLAFRLTLRKQKSVPSGWKENSHCVTWQMGQCYLQRRDMKAEFAPFIRKVQLIPKSTGSDLGGWIFFLIDDCSNNMLLRFTSQSNFFTVYCILLPLSCSPFPTNDTRNTVFNGGRCGDAVIIWKGDKARSLGI